MAYERELQVARALGREAGRLALRYFVEGFTQEDKADASPVTIADKECEKLIVARLNKEFPEDGLLGEEGANQAPANGRRWIIDPVDGTRDFVRKNRLWASMLGLEVDGVVELGVCTFPAMGEQYWGVRGGGAWKEFEGAVTRLQGSPITDIGRAVICANGMQHAAKRPRAEKILPLLSRFWAVRSLGGAMDAMFTIGGHADFWLEPSAQPWDLVVIQLMAKEAGLRYFDYQGNDTIYGGNAIVCTPALEPVAREFLGLP